MRVPSTVIRLPSVHLWPAKIVRVWNHDYQDFRVILEQRGELRYYAVPARWQRRLARAFVLALLASLCSLIALGIVAATLQSQKIKLEQSHQAIFQALVSSSVEEGLPPNELSEGEMLLMAQSIRERDLAIRRYVDSATNQVESENALLQSRLQATGLTERAIKVIQGSNPVGGFHREREAAMQPLLDSAFAEHSSTNRALKDILTALPSQLPIHDHVLTSPFGIRKHPIHGTPRLHAGIDLISSSSDDVFPAKPGKVILARSYNDYGNTVIVRHERGIETLYAHLASISVEAGQEVDLKTVLGQVGNTGSSTGKHLHFEVSVGGYPVDPLKVINMAQYVQQAKIALH